MTISHENNLDLNVKCLSVFKDIPGVQVKSVPQLLLPDIILTKHQTFKLNMTNKVRLYYLMSHIVLFSEFNSVSMLPITLYCLCLVCQVCNIGVSSPESAHSLTSHQPTNTQPLLFVGSLYIRKCKQTIRLFHKSCGIICVLIARAIMLLSMLHILNILST